QPQGAARVQRTARARAPYLRDRKRQILDPRHDPCANPLAGGASRSFVQRSYRSSGVFFPGKGKPIADAGSLEKLGELSTSVCNIKIERSTNHAEVHEQSHDASQGAAARAGQRAGQGRTE